jgi:hypothetical protein
MKLRLTNHQKAGAFTLIEMIGVLAVIAILAALLIPRVFNAINEARVNGTCISANTVKTAVADHYGKYGKFDYLFGTNQITPMPITNYDTAILMPEGLLDKPFSSKLAGGDPQLYSHIELLLGSAAGPSGKGYYLDGSTTNNAVANSPYVVQVHLQNVAAQDAKDLNDQLDGVALGPGNVTSADYQGRVEYNAPANGFVSDLYIYLTSR